MSPEGAPVITPAPREGAKLRREYVPIMQQFGHRPAFPPTYDITEDMRFNTFSGLVIVANAGVLGIEVDMGRYHETVQDRGAFFIVEVLFAVVFTLELVMRLRRRKFDFFQDPWNVMDFHLVVIGVFDIVVSVLFDAPGAKSVTVLRIIRLLRLVRNVRLLRMFQELWVIMKTFVDTFVSLMWVMVVLGLILFVVGLLITTTIGQDTDYWQEWNDSVKYVGDIPRTMFSLFQVITFDKWATKFAGPITTAVEGGSVWSFPFVFFVVVTGYGLLNVTVGVIVEHTLQVASATHSATDVYVEMLEHRIIASLVDDFFDLDTSGRGLSIQSFQKAIHSPVIAGKLQALGVETSDLMELFRVIDHDNSGTVTPYEIMEGLKRVKGNAHGKDMAMLTGIVHRTSARIERLGERVEALTGRAGLLLDRMDSMLGATTQEIAYREVLKEQRKEEYNRAQRRKVLVDRLVVGRTGMRVAPPRRAPLMDTDVTADRPPSQSRAAWTSEGSLGGRIMGAIAAQGMRVGALLSRPGSRERTASREKVGSRERRSRGEMGSREKVGFFSGTQAWFSRPGSRERTTVRPPVINHFPPPPPGQGI
mmetsp:Transcript_18521/g.40988  ORF Transcript_18521/g.40988 Transcript_18521/m.40988 type:complete len:591 (+) Transcript_18521:57-1829(+)